MSTLRAGLVGMGQMGKNHQRVLSNLPEVELVAIVDPRLSGSDEGIPVFSNVDELIQHGIDYAVVATPTLQHEEISIFLARNGIPTLIEKPLALNARQAHNISTCFKKNGVAAAVGHIERFNAAYQQARLRIKDGVIGGVLQIATRRQSHLPSRVTDVGVVMDLATHDIDITTWLCRQRYESISAYTVALSEHGREDLLVASARLSGGTVASHIVNWLSPFKERQAVITGEKGTLVIDSLTSDLTLFSHSEFPLEWDYLANLRGSSDGDVTRFSFAKPEPLRMEHEAFRDFVLGRGASVVTLDDAVDTMVVAEQILVTASASPSGL